MLWRIYPLKSLNLLHRVFVDLLGLSIRGPLGRVNVIVKFAIRSMGLLCLLLWAQKHIDMLLNTMEMKWNESVVDKDNFSIELVTGKNAKEKILSQVTQLTAGKLGNTYHHRKDTRLGLTLRDFTFCQILWHSTLNKLKWMLNPCRLVHCLCPLSVFLDCVPVRLCHW